MTRLANLLLPLFMGITSVSGAAYASPELCKSTASDPYLSARNGSQLDTIDPSLALPACEAAQQQRPHDSLIRYNLARAYYAGGRIDEALALLDVLTEQNFAPSFALLGQIYLDLAETGDDPAEFAEAGVALYEEAVAGGYPLSDDDWLPIWEVYFRYYFTEDGYRHGSFMRTVFDGTGRGEQFDTSVVAMLLQLEEECDGIAIEDTLTLHLLSKPVSWNRGFVGDLNADLFDLGDLWGLDIDFERILWNDALQANIADRLRRDYHDATLFVLRHGCDTPIYEQFYGALSTRASAILRQPVRAKQTIAALLFY